MEMIDGSARRLIRRLTGSLSIMRVRCSWVIFMGRAILRSKYNQSGYSTGQSDNPFREVRKHLGQALSRALRTQDSVGGTAVPTTVNRIRRLCRRGGLFFALRKTFLTNSPTGSAATRRICRRPQTAWPQLNKVAAATLLNAFPPGKASLRERTAGRLAQPADQ